MIDELGNRYERLVVISQGDNYETKHKTLARWYCKCDCGGECLVLGADLRSGHVKSCGCLKHEKAVENCQQSAKSRKGKQALNLVDEIGKVYSGLTVISSLPSKSRKARWLCRCSCGERVEVSGDSLRQGKVTSCGCLYRHVQDFVKKRPRYCDYERNARRRNREFTLSEDEFIRITDLPCAYCGEDGPNGVDRSDNSLGYVAGNAAPCCTVCNRMKLTLTPEQFRAHCRKVAVHQ